MSIVLSFGFLQNNIAIENENSNLMQVGIGSFMASSTCESDVNKAGGYAASGIVAGTGWTIVTTSAPASWNPVGWVGLGAGLIL